MLMAFPTYEAVLLLKRWYDRITIITINYLQGYPKRPTGCVFVAENKNESVHHRQIDRWCLNFWTTLYLLCDNPYYVNCAHYQTRMKLDLSKSKFNQKGAQHRNGTWNGGGVMQIQTWILYFGSSLFLTPITHPHPTPHIPHPTTPTPHFKGSKVMIVHFMHFAVNLSNGCIFMIISKYIDPNAVESWCNWYYINSLPNFLNISGIGAVRKTHRSQSECLMEIGNVHYDAFSITPW